MEAGPISDLHETKGLSSLVGGIQAKSGQAHPWISGAAAFGAGPTIVGVAVSELFAGRRQRSLDDAAFRAYRRAR